VVIRLDPDLTAQALLNLLANAAEAALAGEATPPSVRLGARPSGEGCAIMVEDSGRGVNSEVRAAIFQPFFTTRAEGSGIGLSLARQAIVSQGGQLILAPAKAGTGALFVIEL
jgi:signal transduction histidine kinase